MVEYIKKYLGCVWILLFLNIVATQAQPCNIPFNIRFENKSTTAITVTWSDINNQPDGWEIELVKRGAAQTGTPSLPLQTNKTVVLQNLIPSTSYDLYIRTVCAGSRSQWNVAIPFTTVIEIPSACQLNIPLKDNGTEVLDIDIPYLKTLQNPILGTNIFLKSVDLILEHAWPADLKIILESPQGQQLLLSNHNGTVTRNFGILQDSTCTQFTSFSMDGCRYLKYFKPPFVGAFHPDGDLTTWKPDTLNKGSWKLITFDRAVKDAGILKYMNITFSDDACIVPDHFTVLNTDINEITVGWDFKEPCNTVSIRVFEGDIAVDSFFVPCREVYFTIDNLKPNTEYGFSITSLCTHSQSSSDGCLIYASTSCEPISIAESFDNYDVCEPSCIAHCTNTGSIWFNNTNEDAQDWILIQGKTETEFTGPDGDINGTGKFLYIENNPQLCGQQNQAILESTCMQILSNASGCDMSFYYHMYGSDIKALKLELSVDGGLTWNTLFTTGGDHGNRWIQHTLSLKDFDGQLGVFRFIAISGEGPLGDIAIDQIEFYKSIPAAGLNTYYRDVDGDGYGTDRDFILSCASEAPSGYVLILGDCDDDNAEIHPGAKEIQCNGIDENCNGNEDDQPAVNPILVQEQIYDSSCNGSADGSIQLTIVGGNPPYEVVWNNGKTGESITNLKTGIYYATITDIGGCILHTDFYKIQPTNTLNIIVKDLLAPSCLGKSDGVVAISHSLDAPPYTYLWSNGMTNRDLDNAAEGVYNVTVTDANQCFAVLSDIKLSAKPSVIAGISAKVNPACFGKEDGLLEVFAINGNPPYAYQWEDGQTTNRITHLPSGQYTCTITDDNACQYILETELVDYDPLKVQVVSTEHVRCFGEANGSIKTNVSGGKPGYTYLWNNYSYTDDDIFNVKAGIYTLTVTDANGCAAITESILIAQPDPLEVFVDSILPATCILGGNGQIRLQSRGGNGTYFYVWNEQSSTSNILDSIPRGHYNVTVYDQLGCKSGIPDIEVPYINTAIEIHLDQILNNTCYGEANAAIAAFIANGSPIFDYNWSHGSQYFNAAIRDTIFHLASGRYQLTITDSDGCTGVSNTIIIPEFPVFKYEILETANNVCQDDSLGIIRLKIIGSNQPLDIIWNNGQYAGAELYNLPNGQYYGFVMDDVGCMLSIDTILITAQSKMKLVADIEHVINGGSDGRICIHIDNGAPPYRIEWSNGQVNYRCIEGLKAGIYSVTVTDDYGCKIEGHFIIEEITTVSNEAHPKVAIYPNPVRNILTVATKNPIDKYVLMDMHGSVLDEAKPDIQNDKFTIEMEAYQHGVYMLVLYDASQILVFKVVRL